MITVIVHWEAAHRVMIAFQLELCGCWVRECEGEYGGWSMIFKSNITFTNINKISYFYIFVWHTISLLPRALNHCTQGTQWSTAAAVKKWEREFQREGDKESAILRIWILIFSLICTCVCASQVVASKHQSQRSIHGNGQDMHYAWRGDWSIHCFNMHAYINYLNCGQLRVCVDGEKMIGGACSRNCVNICVCGSALLILIFF